MQPRHVGLWLGVAWRGLQTRGGDESGHRRPDALLSIDANDLFAARVVLGGVGQQLRERKDERRLRGADRVEEMVGVFGVDLDGDVLVAVVGLTARAAARVVGVSWTRSSASSKEPSIR